MPSYIQKEQWWNWGVPPPVVPDTTAPAYLAGSVSGVLLTLKYDEALVVPPAGSQFAATINGVATTLGTPVLGASNEWVVMTMGSSPSAGQSVVVTYTKHPSNAAVRIQDAAGNESPSATYPAITAATLLAMSKATTTKAKTKTKAKEAS